MYYTSGMSPTSQNSPIVDGFRVFFRCLLRESHKVSKKSSLGDPTEASRAQKPSKISPGRSQKDAFFELRRGGGPLFEVRVGLRRALKIQPKFDEGIGIPSAPQKQPKIDPGASKTVPRKAPEGVPGNVSKIRRPLPLQRPQAGENEN